MLKQTPTEAHLSRMYFELAGLGARCVGTHRSWPYDIKYKEELIALACDMSRFDPRLLGILVEFFVNHWYDVNPTGLRNYYTKMKTPQTVAVITEFLGATAKDDEIKFYVRYVQEGLLPVTPQFYFYNLYAPGGRLATHATEEGVYEYKKWGFFAAETPVIDAENRLVAGSFDAVARRNILQRLLKEKGEISLGNYLDAVRHSISRQQALADIKSAGFSVHGTGRGARWKLAINLY